MHVSSVETHNLSLSQKARVELAYQCESLYCPVIC